MSASRRHASGAAELVVVAALRDGAGAAVLGCSPGPQATSASATSASDRRITPIYR